MKSVISKNLCALVVGLSIASSSRAEERIHGLVLDHSGAGPWQEHSCWLQLQSLCGGETANLIMVRFEVIDQYRRSGALFVAGRER